ncbi:MAG: ribonuclease P protein component [Ectothiorhodospira sp.]
MAAERSWRPAAPRVGCDCAPERLIDPGDRCFPRSVRLTRATEYQAVFNGGQRIKQHPFTVVCMPTEGDTPRLGLAISKRSLRLATRRQRIKRLVRESFRHHRGGLPPLDVVVMVRQGAVEYTNRDLYQILDRLWSRVIRQCRSSSSS